MSLLTFNQVNLTYFDDVHITGVERIIIGGQIYHLLKDKLLPIVKKTANKHAISNGMKNVDILLNQLGPEAPALGATLL